LEKVEADFFRFVEHLRNSEVNVNAFMEGMTKLERILIDARQEEFFKGLFADRPDLMPKFVIAA
jgi:hypothetical protein